jgi:hypothetical protein
MKYTFHIVDVFLISLVTGLAEAVHFADRASRTRDPSRSPSPETAAAATLAKCFSHVWLWWTELSRLPGAAPLLLVSQRNH